MTQNRNEMKLDGLRDEIHEPLKVFAEQVIAGLSDNLQSITVVGSSLTGDFKPGQSDINTVLVLRERTLEALKTISGMAKQMRKKKLSAPLLMTPSYIQRSRDVFGIEFLDFQLTHRTILGDDPFGVLSFDKKDVRLQCERELKATLIRLRQGYIAAAGRKRLVRDILISAAKGLAPLLRAMLWLKDIERPVRAESVFRKAAGEFSVDLDALAAARTWQHAKARLGETEITTAFESIYVAVEQLALTVDKLEV